MNALRAVRRTHPGRWLAAATALDLVTYTPGHGRAVVLWLLIDLWLVRRIWLGGSTALALVRFLQTFGLLLSIIVVVSDALDGPITPLKLALYGASLWCLKAPALSAHVGSRTTTAGDPVATR